LMFRAVTGTAKPIRRPTLARSTRTRLAIS
jgi:hypothetical protein